MSKHEECNLNCMHLYLEAVDDLCLSAFVHRYGLGGCYVLEVYRFHDIVVDEVLVYRGSYEQLENALLRLFDYSGSWRCCSIKGGADLEGYERVRVLAGVEVAKGACEYAWN